MPAPMFPLAASSEMLFADRPWLDRVQRIHELGYQVEMWDWTTKDLDAAAALGVTWSTMTGYVHGDLYDADRGRDVVETAKPAIEAALRLGCPRLVLHGAELNRANHGLPFRPQSVISGRMWLSAYRTLETLAGMAEAAGVVFCLENLNLVIDHVGTPFGRAEDVLALVETLDRPGVRMLLDLYHAQIGEGNLIELIQRAAPWIGEVQVADVPGRHEPGTGEVNWPAVARALRDAGFSGVVALEARPSADDELALKRFRAAFSE